MPARPHVAGLSCSRSRGRVNADPQTRLGATARWVRASFARSRVRSAALALAGKPLRWRTGPACTSRGGGSATAPRFREATVEEMHAPQVSGGATYLFADDTSDTYALGWSRTAFEGHPYLCHGGGIFGFPP